METRTIGFDQVRTEQFFRDMKDRVRVLPGVESVSLAASVPMGYSNEGGRVFPEGQIATSKEATPSAFYNIVDPAYFTTMRIPFCADGLYRAGYRQNPKVAVINEAMANKLWPGQDALGKASVIQRHQARSLKLWA